MGAIPPISSSGYIYSHGEESNNKLNQQFFALIEEFRSDLEAWLKDPSAANLDKLKEVGSKMLQFLEKNKSALFAEAKKNGWPETGMEGYESFFNSTIGAINNLLHPSHGQNMSGVIDMVNEQSTELHYLVSNQKP